MSNFQSLCQSFQTSFRQDARFFRRTIVEVKAAKGIQDISDCKKLVGYRNIYRIRLGDYRALFTLEIEFSGDTIFFQYLAPRGEAYGKKMKTELKRIDKE